MKKYSIQWNNKYSVLKHYLLITPINIYLFSTPLLKQKSFPFPLPYLFLSILMDTPSPLSVLPPLSSPSFQFPDSPTPLPFPPPINSPPPLLSVFPASCESHGGKEEGGGGGKGRRRLETEALPACLLFSVCRRVIFTCSYLPPLSLSRSLCADNLSFYYRYFMIFIYVCLLGFSFSFSFFRAFYLHSFLGSHLKKMYFFEFS